MAQMKEQNSRKRDKQNGDKLLDEEFKTLVTRMLYKLRWKADELRENFNSIKKGMETIFKKSEIKNTLTEMKNNLQGINSGLDKAENQISDLEY